MSEPESEKSGTPVSTCQRCGSARLFFISSKASDCHFARFGDKDTDGYAPGVPNFCGGDNVEATLCLECGQIQGAFPVPDPEME